MKLRHRGDVMMMMRKSMMIVVALLLLTAATTTMTQSIQTIGFDEANVTDDGTDPSQFVLARSVFLLPNSVQLPGILFAFSVYFRSHPDPVVLQLYRPIDAASKSYRLIAEFNIIPSVPKGREDLYIESLLTRRCIAILPGDRLGVYVTADPPSLQLKFNADIKVSLYKVTRRPLLGEAINGPTEFPLFLRAKAYVLTNNSLPASALNSSSVEVDCVFGLIIPGAFNGVSFTTTTLPITGAVGATGATGPVGFTGNTGERGLPGAPGSDGPKGPNGDPGPMGLTGPIGATGSTGAKGSQGEPGATGSTGFSEPGDPGSTGPQGPVGEMGRNQTIILNRQLPPKQGQLDECLSDSSDPFWSSATAIWATYIWLAIVSLFLLIVTVVIIVIMTLHASISREHRSPPKSARSRSNILDEEPSMYSETAFQ